jgi:hypothetical protein
MRRSQTAATACSADLIGRSAVRSPRKQGSAELCAAAHYSAVRSGTSRVYRPVRADVEPNDVGHGRVPGRSGETKLYNTRPRRASSTPCAW